jgi:hypothetical protein
LSATALSDALRAAGVPCAVETWDKLALITVTAPEFSFADEALRRRVLALSREHGFTHAAVELAAAHDSATVRRD